MTDSEGTFVGKIREEYEQILNKISENCFDINVFKCDYSYKVIEHIRDKYGYEVEYLLEKLIFSKTPICVFV